MSIPVAAATDRQAVDMFKRILIMCCFLGVQWIYNCTLLDVVPMPFAYFTMAISDALIYITLPLFGYSRLTADLQDINYFAIKLHAFGFAIYMLYFPHVTYNYAIYILAIIQYVRLFYMADDDDKNYIGRSVYSDRFGVLRNSFINLSRVFNQEKNQ